jgi:hypothetical protein
MLRLGARAMMAGHQLLGERHSGHIVRLGAQAMGEDRYVLLAEIPACWPVRGCSRCLGVVRDCLEERSWNTDRIEAREMWAGHYILVAARVTRVACWPAWGCFRSLRTLQKFPGMRRPSCADRLGARATWMHRLDPRSPRKG